MAGTEITTDTPADDGQSDPRCGELQRIDAGVAARNQLLEFARALARIAAHEDDAAEYSEAGPSARSKACTASAERRQKPIRHG